MSADEPVPLREGLERVFRHLGAPPVNVITQLEQRWADVVGPAMAEATRPIELQDGVLTIGCSDPAWAAQVGWMEAQIRDRFVRVFPEVSVTGVVGRVVLG